MCSKAFIETKFTNKVDESVLQKVLINAAYDKNNCQKGIIFIDSTGSEKKIEYKELLNRSIKVLGRLQSIGIDKGSYLIFQIENDVEFIEIFWACILGGIIPVAVTVPSNTSSKKDVFKKYYNITRQIGDNYTIIEDKICDEFAEDYENISERYIKTSEILSHEENEGKIRGVNLDDVAYIQYSSGSTGTPKGVVLKNRNLIYNIQQIKNKIKLNETDISESWMPLTHDMGLVGFHLAATIAKIDQIRMQPNVFIRKPLLFLEKIKEHHVTITCSPNFGLKWMINKIKESSLENIDLSSLRLIFNGAEPISMNIVKGFNEKFAKCSLKSTAMYQVYGMAEACLAVTFPELNSEPQSVIIDRRSTCIGKEVKYVDIADKYSSEYAVVGKPLEGMKVKIIDDEGMLLDENCMGNIVISGDNVFQSYFKSDEAKFTKDNFFNTGDLGFCSHGELIIVGRKKDIIFINGKNYYSNDLEEFIGDTASVDTEKCAVTAVFNNELGQDDIMVFVKTRCPLEKFITTYKEVKKTLFDNLGINVKTVIPIKNIPKTTSGKPKRFVLMDEYNRGIYDDVISELKELAASETKGQNEEEAREDEASKRVLKIVREILKSEDISLFDDIFELGFDSIKLIYLISEIKNQFNVEFEFTEILKVKNLYELVQLIKKKDKAACNFVYPKFLGEKDKWHEKFDLTEVQKAYLLGRQDTFDLGNVAAHAYYEFESSLNVNKFNVAFNKVINRQPMLRTVISKDGSQQVLKEVPPYEVKVEDLRKMSKEAALKRIEEERSRMSDYVFDTEKWPLFEVKAFTLNDEKNYFLFGFDLLTIDGSSINLLLKEVLEYYKNPDLVKDDLDFSFYDYIQGTKKIKESHIYQKDIEYWQSKLAAFPEAPKLPTITSVKNIEKPHFKRLIKKYPKEFWQNLKKAASQHRVTPSIILFSMYAEILSKYSNQSKLAINTTVFNRYPFNKDVNNIIGDFTSLLLIDVNLEDSKEFWKKTQKVQETFLNALDHRHYSAIEFMKDLLQKNTDRDDIIMPVVFTSMLFDDLYKSDINEDIINIKYSVSQTPQVFLDFQVLENDLGLSLSFDYVSELFDEKMINAMFTLLMKKVEALVKEDKLIETVTKEDRAFIENYNNSREDIEPELLQEMIRRQVSLTPDNIAIKHESRSITYREMWLKSNRIARYLKSKGCKLGDYVIVMASRKIETIINVIGVLKAGCAYIPVDPEWPKERIEYVLENSHGKTIIDAELYENEEIHKISDEEIEPVKKLNTPAYVIYTSGSTGSPKGVVINHSAVSNTIKDINNKFNVGEDDKILALSSMCFDLSVYDIFGSLTSGAELVLINDLLDVKNIINTIRKENITICNSVPAVMDMITANMSYDEENVKYWLSNRNVKINVSLDDKLRLVLLSGDWIRKSLPDFIRSKFKMAQVISLGGATEASIWSIYYPIKKVLESFNSIPYGYPLANQKFYVLDYKKEECPLGVQGELYIGGIGVADGYLNDEEKTKNAFINHERLGRIYKTGDYGILKKEGYIEFIGRLDSQVKLNGHRVELGEIENALLKINCVDNAAVIVHQTKDGAKQLIAYLVLKKDVDNEVINAELAKTLPGYMLPKLYVKIDEMPLSYNGKLDRKRLPKPDLMQDVMKVTKRDEALTLVERKLLSIWEKILKSSSITIDSDFFALGGDSLKGINLINEINKEFNIDIPYRELFKKTTIREIAKYIELTDYKVDTSIKKVKEQEYYNVSSAQERMYVLNQLDPKSVLYNTTGVLEFKGSLDFKALEDALNKLIARHEVFRTYFAINDNHVVQKIKEKIEVKIDVNDLSLNGKPQKEIIKEKISEFIKPFDLGIAPIFRVKMFIVEKDRYLIAFDTHHIISDALSQEIIIRDIAALYEGKELEKLDIQYKDYAKWQNDYLNSEKMNSQKDYWCNVYKSSIPSLDLNTDFPRQKIQSHKGDLISINLKKDIYKKVKKLKDETGTTIYMILLTAINILLEKYSGQKDIAIGSPVAGRKNYELRNLAGIFVNTIAIRNELNDNLKVREFLNAVKENVLKAFENDDYPFEKLVEVLKVQRDVSRNPIFDVFFALQNMEETVVKAENYKMNKYDFHNSIAKFDLSIYAYEKDDSMKFEFEYCTDLFKKETILRMAQSLMTLIDDLAENPNKEIKDLKKVSLEDEKILLGEINNTEVKYNEDKCIHELFEETVEKHKNKTALICNNESMTYDELNMRSNQLASVLRKEEVKNNDIVGILVNRSFEMIIAILAVLKSGAGYLPIDPDFPEERIQYVISDSETKIILSSSKYQDKLNEDVKYIDLYDEDIYSQEKNNLTNVNVPSDIAYVIYTSGSTGKPKGVVLEHKSVNNFINVIPKVIDFNEKKRILNVTTMSFDIFVLETLLPLSKGLTVVIASEKEQKDPYHLRELVKKEKINMIQMTPSMFRMQINDEMTDYFESVKTIMLGGEALPSDLLKVIRSKGDWKIYNMYGPTETTVWSTIKDVTDDDINIGRPIGNTKVYILDAYRKICPIGVPGELCIGGHGLARGYLKRPQLTDEKFISNPYEKDKKIYCTGDLVKINEKGEIVFLNRIDNQVKIRGHRIELSEIDVKLKEINGVLEAVTAIKENSYQEKYICGYVVAENEDVMEKLKDELKKSLPDYMIPSYFVKLEKMPLTPNGKIDRKSLPMPNKKASKAVKHEKARNKIEEALIDIWKKVLERDDVGIDDNFFEAGGTSLGIVRIANEINEQMKVEIDATTLFEYPSIRKLSSYLSSDEESNEELKKKVNKEAKDIAVVGMSLKVPQAKNIFEFWNNLKDAKECISYFSDEELRKKGVSDELLSNSRYVKAASILDDIECFDAKFFGYTEMDAKVMDPQIRLFEECAWEALEDAGHVVEDDNENIGLFAGGSANLRWQMRVLNRENSGMAEMFNRMHLCDKEFLTTQTSYKLNLKGPSMYINTACSTGLVALHLACQSIRNGECNMALAGAVNATEFKKNGYLYEDGMIFSKDGHCRAFDEKSSGTIFGDGVGVVVLKALDEAVKDKDNIYAVIKGIAVNNDGNQKVGYTAPSIEGQKRVIMEALYDSSVNAETIGYVETHGTGTKLGDPIEVSALTQAYHSNKKGYCAIGSVKTNIGHLDVAAGVVGLIKTILSLKHKEIPASLNFESPNPQINFKDSPFYVNTKLKKWSPIGENPLRAAVSSFGIGGTNAHVILEEAPKIERSIKHLKYNVINLSAKSEKALKEAAGNLASFLEKNEDINIEDAAFTLAVGRKDFKYRNYLICESKAEAVEKLRMESFSEKCEEKTKEKQNIVFMFTGQGSQYLGMGKALYERFMVFRNEIDKCAEICEKYLGYDIREVMFKDKDNKINETETTQAVLFIFEYSLAKLWNSLGIKQDVMIGHSLGEYVAATLAGVFSIEDAIKLIVARGKLMQSMKKGSMISVMGEEEIVKPLIDETVEIAAENSKGLSVLTGEDEAIDIMREKMKNAGLRVYNLKTSHAFHSKMMTEAAKELRKYLDDVKINKPEIPYISNLTGDYINYEDILKKDYFADHMLNTVKFSKGIAKLLERGKNVFIEIGSAKTLAGLVRNNAEYNNNCVVAGVTKKSNEDCEKYVCEVLANVWKSSDNVNWHQYYSELDVRKISLPTYAFQRNKYTLSEEFKKNNLEELFASPQIEEEEALSEEEVLPVKVQKMPLNERVQEIVKRVLGNDDIGYEDNLLELGVDSLKIIMICNDISKELKVEIPLSTFFKDATIKSLIDFIGNNSKCEDNQALVKVHEQESYELSSTQKWMYVLQMKDENNVAYNLPNVYEIKGEVSFSDFESVINTIINRHEAFRTYFLVEDGKVVQKVKDAIDFKLDYCEDKRNIDDLIDEFIKPFDLSEAPLFRAKIIKNNDKQYLLIDMHHIISDGISRSILMREINELYCGGKLGKVTLEYKDYAAWQRKQRDTEKYRKDEKYWLNKFNDKIPELNLQGDYKLIDRENTEGESFKFKLLKETSQSLREVAEKTGTTINMVLLSAFYILLAEYSKMEDINIGVPITGRTSAEVENIIGVFVNTIVLRAKPDFKKSYESFLKEVKNESVNSYEHQNYLFEDLVDKLNNREALHGNQLFEVMFSMLNKEVSMKMKMGNMSLMPYEMKNRVSKFNLTLYAVDDKENLSFEMEYKTKLFKQSTIKRMCMNYMKILEEIALNSKRNISGFQCLCDEEKNKLLVDFNNTDSEYPKDKTIIELFEEQVEKTPQKTAVQYENEKLTFNDLNKKVNKLAGYLRDKGVKANSVVGIMINHSFEFIIGLLGVLKAGGAYVPIDVSYPKERIEYMLNNSDSTLVLVNNEELRSLNLNTEMINILDLNLDEYSEVNPLRASSVNDLAYLIYTSGSTGKPKGVMVENRGLVNYIWWAKKKYVKSKKEVFALYSSVSFDLTVTSIFTPLISGSKMIIYSGENSAFALMKAMKEKEVTVVKLTPAHLSLINKMDNHMSSVKRFIVGGEELKVSLAASIDEIFKGKVEIINEYGPTETVVGCMYYKFDKNKACESAVSIGKPADNVQLYILDKDLNLLPMGVLGELYIGGDGVSRGYMKREKLTEESFISNPYGKGKLYKTGDLAKWHEDGNMEFIGRADDQVKIRGFRIELGDIESRLLEYDSIEEAAVVLRENSEKEKYISAYVVSKKEINLQDLKKHLEMKLPRYMIPTSIKVIEKMPLTSNGKIDKKALAKYEVTEEKREFEAPTTELEKMLCNVWSEILNVEKVGVNDDFFELGGQSIKAIDFIIGMEKYGLKLQFKDLFDNPTVKQLASFIEKIKDEKDADYISQYIEEKCMKELNLKVKVLQCVEKKNVKRVLLYEEQEQKLDKKKLQNKISEILSAKKASNYIVGVKNLEEVNHDEMGISGGELNKLIGLKENFSEEIVKKTIDKLSREEEQFIKEITEQEIIDTYPCSPIQKEYLKFKPHYTGLIIPINMMVAENKICEALSFLIKNNGLLRSNIYSVGKDLKIREYKAGELSKIPFIDLSEYSEEIKKKVIKEIVLNKYYKNYFVLNSQSIYYRFFLIKEDLKTYKIIAPINHVIYDGMSGEILTKQINDYLSLKEIKTNSKKKTYKDYQNTLQKGTKVREDELLEKFNLLEYSKYNNEVAEKIAAKSSDCIESVEFKIPLNDIRERALDIWEYSFALTVSICKEVFNIEKVPLKIMSYGREYGNEKFYDVLGYFSDFIPVLIDTKDNEKVRCEKVRALLSFVKENNINFASILANDELKEKWQKSIKCCQNTLEDNKDQMIIYNFQGKRESYDDIEGYYSLGSDDFKKFRLEGSSFGIFSYYTEENLVINLLTKYPIDKNKFNKLIDKKI